MLELERMQQMLLSTHFALGEFLRSGTAIKYGIDNTPQSSMVIIRLMMLCEQVLEPLRLHCGIITITSGISLSAAQPRRAWRTGQSAYPGRGCRHLHPERGDSGEVQKIHRIELHLRPADPGASRCLSRQAPLAARKLHHAAEESSAGVDVKFSNNLIKRDEFFLITLK